MADIAFLLVIAAFFALCVAYVRSCDRIIETTDVSDHDGASS